MMKAYLYEDPAGKEHVNCRVSDEAKVLSSPLHVPFTLQQHPQKEVLK